MVDKENQRKVTFSGGERTSQWVQTGLLLAAILGGAFKLGAEIRSNTTQTEANGTRIDQLREDFNSFDNELEKVDNELGSVKNRLRKLEQ